MNNEAFEPRRTKIRLYEVQLLCWEAESNLIRDSKAAQ